MSSDRVTVLEAEFKTLSNRLKETRELSEELALVDESLQLIQEMEELIVARQMKRQMKLDRTKRLRPSAPIN